MNSFFLKKIKKNYILSFKKYDDFSASKYWTSSIKKKKKLFNIEKLSNFRNNGLSTNIDENYINKNTSVKYFNLLLKRYKFNEIKKFLDKKNIGNYDNINSYKNYLYSASDIFLIKYLFDIKKKIDLNKINIICEIGQGYGLLASKFLKIKKFKYIMIDLPESNFITSYFLKKQFPKIKIIQDMDLKNGILSMEQINQADIFILSPWVKIGKIKVDLFINTRSMMEMKFSTISKYFELIHKNISKNGFFFNANRYIKFRAGQPIFLKDYPYDKFWKVISSSKSFNQDHIHQLITERKYDINSKEIKLELDKILEETKNYLQPDEFRYLNRNYFKEKNYFLKAVKKLLYHFGKLLFRRNYNKFKQKLYALYNKINK